MEKARSRTALLEKANSLPPTPGVYLMKNAQGRVIYVGKSRKLKNRVSQYFQNSGKTPKTARMVMQVADFDYFLCDTEIEALSLENTLIKQYAPRYNIRLKDAKSYPYIKITAEEYPRLEFTRTRKSDRAKYFGPYSGASVAGGVLRTLQKMLGIPHCHRRFPEDFGRERPCLSYQLGQCCGLCTGKVGKEEYAALVRDAIEILRGNTAAVRAAYQTQMEEAAENEFFERAALCRDRIRALDKLADRQKVVASPDANEDVFGFYQNDYGAALTIFYVRGGALIDKNEIVFGSDEILDADALLAYVYHQYRANESIPPRVFLNFDAEAEDLASLEASLSEIAGRRVRVEIPQRGEHRKLSELAAENARERLLAEQRTSKQSEEVLARLAELLALEVLPMRIESYDVSNFGVEHKTCGMIVLENAKFVKSDYRIFHMKEVEGTDDYASIREAILRRFAHSADVGGSFSKEPDLILLDGGRTHVATVKRALAEKGVFVPVFGMVKDAFHKTRALCGEENEISIARDRAVFTLIYSIQEEVHRFSIREMSRAKRATLRTSSLEKIDGVGKEKAKALLAHFGGLAAVKTADRSALAAAPGVGPRLADTIFAYFHKEGSDK